MTSIRIASPTLVPLAMVAVMSCASTEGPDHDAADFDALWDHADPAATEVRFRELLDRPGIERDAEVHAQLLTQLARTHSLRGRFDEAHAILDRAELLVDDATPIARARLLIERGRTFHSAGRRAEAVPLFEAAWERANAAGARGHAVDAAHMLGIACEGDEALAWNERGIAHALESGEPDALRWLGPLYNNAGLWHLERGRHDEALRFYTLGHEWRAQQPGQERETRIARWCVAHTLRKMGSIEEALAIFRELAGECEQADDPDAYVFEELAECLDSLGQEAEARELFAQAYDEFAKDPSFADDEPERARRLREKAGRAR